MSSLTNDFEVKRFILGLTSIITSDPAQLPQTVQTLYPQLVKAVVFLCNKSIEITIKEFEKSKEKQEEAIEDKLEGEAICDDEEVVDLDIESDEEEDEDYDYQQEQNNNDLYESKLEPIDDILYVRNALNQLQTSNQQLYQYLISCMD